MLIPVAAILDQATLTEIHQTLSALSWRDGADTAGATAKAVKRNRQADLASREGAKLHARLLAAIEASPVVRAAARPKRFSRLMVSAAGQSEGYGAHVDNAIMALRGGTMRSDVAFTLFLSAPSAYEGGELIIEHPGVDQAFKLEAGEMLVYPASSIHRVAPITAGERVVCVGWIESLVREPDRREILFDLENVRADLAGSDAASARAKLTLDKAIGNLLRAWSAP